jgi:endonuclease/exonuclease/phosphatase family metal-dependent hydrolase
MTRNLYFGADVYRILDAQSLFDVTVKVSEILTTIEDNRPWERMEAIADEIAATRPHLVALQEVYLIRTQSPSDFLSGSNTPAEDVRFDYLKLLLESLQARGLHYRVAAETVESDVELPGLAGFVGNEPILFDGRMTDRDVILARADVPTGNPYSQQYQFLVPLQIGDISIESTRGFTSVDAWVRGRKYRVVNTHLEIAEGGARIYQSLQATELLATLATMDDPVLLAGDFNSSSEDPIVDAFLPPYRQLADAGYVDVWLRRLGRPIVGNTCCNAEFLDNPEPTLEQRVDQIWVRNFVEHERWPVVGPVLAKLVGDQMGDRTASGLWPSDHAGVVAWMRLPKVGR